MQLEINGQRREFPELGGGSTVHDLIEQLKLKGDRVAVERNGEIVSRAEWAATAIGEGDRFEIVHFVGGGTASGIARGLGMTMGLALAGLLALCLPPACFADSAPAGPQPPMIGPTLVGPPVSPGAPLRIVAYGDTRFTDPSDTDDTSPKIRKYLVEQVAAVHPLAIFMTGDLPFVGARRADWQVYESESEAWRTGHIAVYPALGNHDVEGGYAPSIRNFDATFPELRGYLYYSVRIGNVYLMTLDCTESYAEGSPQRKWIASQLAHLPEGVDFVFFVSHMPLMADLQSQIAATLPEPKEVSLRDFLVAEAPKVHAKFVVVNGHIHNYERYEDHGISYIVSGGGGAAPYEVVLRGDQDLYRDRSFPNYHFLVLDFHGKTAEVTMYRVKDREAYRLSLEVKDRFVLSAEGK